MTTVRLPVDMEQRLQSLSAAKHKTKSELIKEALDFFFEKEDSEKYSFELGKEYFGKIGSGQGNLSTDYKKLIKDKIRAKLSSH